jgi:ABC-type nickel/cobalt efflux system permease component RcnA
MWRRITPIPHKPRRRRGTRALAFAGVSGAAVTRRLSRPPSHDRPQHDHGHDHKHDHGHALAAEQPDALSWRSLLALGISGGLLPCPSALILMLSAIALRQVGVGLVLILAFSIGLASVLTGIGLIMVYAGRFLERLPVRHSAVTTRLLPVASATFITVAGLAITVRALVEAGVL